VPRVWDFLSIGVLPPGPLNAITDIAGVRVGHVTISRDRLCTGVTAVLAHGGNLYQDKVTAASAVLNGYGKSVGLMQIDELGTIETPILLTGTLNVPRAADALITYMLDQDARIGVSETVNPVVLECFDGFLSDARARPAARPKLRKPSARPVRDPSRSAAPAPDAGCGPWASRPGSARPRARRPTSTIASASSPCRTSGLRAT
jgi:D-aminopeptidase